MKEKGPGDNKPNDDKERQRNRKRWQSALVASQFAYTLVIATLLMGWLGHWLGSLLGGGLWSTILMFLLGSAGFVAEMWRMYKFFAPKDGDDDDDDGSNGQPGDAPSGTKAGARRNEGPDGNVLRPGDHDDRRDNDGIERPGEAGDGLSREELDEIIREIEGLTKAEREELEREVGHKTDGSSINGEAETQDSQSKPKDNKNSKGSNE